jgi:hypothetical protein
MGVSLASFILGAGDCAKVIKGKRMLYSILIYGPDAEVAAWTPEELAETMGRHTGLRRELVSAGRLGPVLRLDRNEVKTVRHHSDRKYITDGPYAETKEQLLGIYVVDCPTFDDAVAATERLNFKGGFFEISPLMWLDPGVVAPLVPEEELRGRAPWSPT